jgi:hypothetical protein
MVETGALGVVIPEDPEETRRDPKIPENSKEFQRNPKKPEETRRNPKTVICGSFLGHNY